MSRNRLLNVLDLGCGKRGDIYKYRNHNSVLKSYYGVDVAKDCVDNLGKLYGEMRRDYRRKESSNPRAHHANHRMKPFFDGHFLCTDMTAPDLSDQLRRHIKLIFAAFLFFFFVCFVSFFLTLLKININFDCLCEWCFVLFGFILFF